MKWDELAGLWERINRAMGGTLLVMMTTCKGINAIKAANSTSAPFFGLIGVNEILDSRQARPINVAFYKTVADGGDIKDFIENAQFRWGKDFVRGLTAEFWTKQKAGAFGKAKTA